MTAAFEPTGKVPRFEGYDVDASEMARRQLRQWSTSNLINLASRGWEASLQRRLASEFAEMDYGRCTGKEFFAAYPFYNIETHAYVLDLIAERIA